MNEASAFFAMNGYVVFNIDYRLAPQFPYPAALHDAQTAVQFIRAHAQEYGVDPSRIGAMGGSAGATLVASLAAASNGHWDSGSAIAATVCLSAVLDLTRVLEERSHRRVVLNAIRDYIGMPGKTASFLTSSPEAQGRLKAASPYYQIEKGDPPMFVANARIELLPIDQAMFFVDKLQLLDIPHQTLYPARGHAMAYFEEAKQAALAFLDQYVMKFKGSVLPPRGSTPSPSLSTGSGAIEPANRSSSALLPILVVAGVLVVIGLILASFLRSRRLNR